MKAYLILEDGTVFEGISIGADKEVISEIVFNTSMAGYLEVLTDPSYAGQAVCMTYPLIGNYGVCRDDCESRRPWPDGFIVRELSGMPSNFRSDCSIQEYLKEYDVPGIAGIDTRALTKILREKGTMNGMITTNEKYDLEEILPKLAAYTTGKVVEKVSCAEKYEVTGAEDLSENGPVSGSAVFHKEAYAAGVKEKRPSLVKELNGKGKRVEELRAALEGGGSADLTVEVSEQAYDGAGLQELFHRSTALLEREILGENQSLDRIEQDMNLVTEVPGEPVDVSWELDRYDVMNVYGELQEGALSPEGTLVNLKAVLTYQEDETRQALYECTAMVYPRTLGADEARQKNLEQKIRDRDKETQTREELRLPDEVDGEGVRYYPRLDIRGLVIMGMALMTGFLLLAKEKQDLLKEQQKRKEQMIRDYPEIISKLTLFLGAGMTVKRAWKKIITDYETKGKARGERYIYEEMIRTAREMDSGVMESESYERFGRRCQVQEYMRLGALLSQNLRKGTKGLTQMLRMEAIQAFEERKARAKRLGEEAGTKLLAPMFLMLAVVLVIVIVPAFLSIQL